MTDKQIKNSMHELRHRQQEEPKTLTKESSARLEQQMNNPQKNPFFPHYLPKLPDELFESWVKKDKKK